jgi:DNA-binding transcriptional ArsR family regulator
MPEEPKDNSAEKDKQVSAVAYNPLLFHNDEELYYIYKKVEAVSGAIFLVTNHISETEVIKGNLRQQALQCLGLTVNAVSGFNINIADLQKISSQLAYLNSLLDIAFWSGLITQMNSSLIQREISSVSATLNDIVTKYKNVLYLDSSFFEVPVIKDKGQEKPERVSNTGTPHKEQNTKGQAIKDKLIVFDNVPKAMSVTRPSISPDKSDRREAILKLLAQRSGLTVKDFLEVITGYSEKTIQRELLALVAEGVIKKEGERRWSTYSLPQ